jgi:hypothetical protein
VLYEHVYKNDLGISALLSAFGGTVLPDYHPYSQAGPGAFCVWLIVFFIWQRTRLRTMTGRMMKKEKEKEQEQEQEQGSPAQSV